MTYKRFNYVAFDGFDDNGEYITPYQVVELLNELHEENIELHIQNDFLKDENQHMRDLVNENEQLKRKITREIGHNQRLHKDNLELHEENQYLKSLKWNQDCINEISIDIQQRQSLEKENEQLKKKLQLLKAEKTYETITLREQVSNETIEKFKKDLQNGEFIELTERPKVRKHPNDHIGWKGGVE